MQFLCEMLLINTCFHLEGKKDVFCVPDNIVFSQGCNTDTGEKLITKNILHSGSQKG